MTIHTVTVNPALDVSAEAPTVVPGEKIRCTTSRVDPGGGGVNVSRVAHRLGADTVALLTSGGATGDEVQALLAAEGVSMAVVPIGERTRQSMTVHAVDTSDEYRFVLPGPRLTETERDSLQAELHRRLRPGDVVVLSGSLPPDTPTDFYATLAREATASGARVAVDTSGEALRAALAEGVWLVKPSRRELEELVAEPITGTLDAVSAATTLVSSGRAEIVAVSLGSDGAVVVSAEGAWHASAPRVQARSTVGAGDSFLAGLLVALDKGEPMDAALATAVAAGAATAMTEGTALCDSEVIQKLASRVKVVSL